MQPKQEHLLQHTSAREQQLLEEEEILVKIAIGLSKALERSNMTKQMLAKQAGLSEKQVSLLLCAENNPSMRTLAKVCRVLHVQLHVAFV